MAVRPFPKNIYGPEIHMANTAPSAISATLESILLDRPVYRELVETFAPLLQKQAELKAEFLENGPALPTLDMDRVRQGVPILAEYDCAQLQESLLRSSRSLLPILRGLIPQDQWPEGSGNELFEDGKTLAELAEARLSGDRKRFESTSTQPDGLDTPVLLTLMDAIIAPVLASIAGRLGESVDPLKHPQGTCPVCGSMPSLATLARREQTDLEHLVGGGGKKHLHCSLCGHDWAFRRDTCPVCGNTDQDSREILFVEDVKHERIEACHKCHTYTLCIDLREYGEDPEPEAIQLGLIHLDMLAQERKLAPIVSTTWNTFQA